MDDITAELTESDDLDITKSVGRDLGADAYIDSKSDLSGKRVSIDDV